VVVTKSLALLALSASLLQAQAPAGRDFNSPQHGFRFTPPAGWVQRNQVAALVTYQEPATVEPVAAQPPPGRTESTKDFTDRVLKATKSSELNIVPKFIANVTVTATPTPARTVQDYMKTLRQKGKLPKNYKIVGEAPFKLAGEPAVARAVRVTFPDQPTVQTREVICLRNGFAINITLATEASAYAKYKSIFDNILLTFIWAPRAP
jgi:hypothetical protein